MMAHEMKVCQGKHRISSGLCTVIVIKRHCEFACMSGKKEVILAQKLSEETSVYPHEKFSQTKKMQASKFDSHVSKDKYERFADSTPTRISRVVLW